MIGGVDGYKWNITDSYDNNLNQRNNVNNKDELGQKGAVDKSKTTECQTCKNRKYVDLVWIRLIIISDLCVRHTTGNIRTATFRADRCLDSDGCRYHFAVLRGSFVIRIGNMLPLMCPDSRRCRFR